MFRKFTGCDGSEDAGGIVRSVEDELSLTFHRPRGFLNRTTVKLPGLEFIFRFMCVGVDWVAQRLTYAF